jgi:hypothetical protein
MWPAIEKGISLLQMPFFTTVVIGGCDILTPCAALLSQQRFATILVSEQIFLRYFFACHLTDLMDTSFCSSYVQISCGQSSFRQKMTFGR